MEAPPGYSEKGEPAPERLAQENSNSNIQTVQPSAPVFQIVQPNQTGQPNASVQPSAPVFSQQPPPNYSLYQELTTATQDLINPSANHHPADARINLPQPRSWNYDIADCCKNKKSLINSCLCPCFPLQKVYEKAYGRKSCCRGLCYGISRCACLGLTQQQIHWCIVCHNSTSSRSFEPCVYACCYVPPPLITSCLCYACLLASLVHRVKFVNNITVNSGNHCLDCAQACVCPDLTLTRLVNETGVYENISDTNNSGNSVITEQPRTTM